MIKPFIESIPTTIEEFNWIEQDIRFGEIQKYRILFSDYYFGLENISCCRYIPQIKELCLFFY